MHTHMLDIQEKEFNCWNDFEKWKEEEAHCSFTRPNGSVKRIKLEGKCLSHTQCLVS